LAGENVAVRQRHFEEVGRYRLTMCFRKSAGTVRSRRCQSAKKGFGGGSHQQAKSEISAPAEISDFPHLYIQMPCLQNSKLPSTVLFLNAVYSSSLTPAPKVDIF